MPPRCAPACHPARSGRCGDSINWDYSTGCQFVPPPNWPRLWARRRNGCCTALVQRKRPIPVHWKLPSQFRRKFPSKFLRKLLSGLFRKLTRKLLKLPSKFCGQLTAASSRNSPAASAANSATHSPALSATARLAGRRQRGGRRLGRAGFGQHRAAARRDPGGSALSGRAPIRLRGARHLN